MWPVSRVTNEMMTHSRVDHQPRADGGEGGASQNFLFIFILKIWVKFVQFILRLAFQLA